MSSRRATRLSPDAPASKDSALRVLNYSESGERAREIADNTEKAKEHSPDASSDQRSSEDKPEFG